MSSWTGKKIFFARQTTIENNNYYLILPILPPFQ